MSVRVFVAVEMRRVDSRRPYFSHLRAQLRFYVFVTDEPRSHSGNERAEASWKLAIFIDERRDLAGWRDGTSAHQDQMNPYPQRRIHLCTRHRVIKS